MVLPNASPSTPASDENSANRAELAGPVAADFAQEGAFWEAPPRYSMTSAAPPPLDSRQPRFAAKFLFVTLISVVGLLGVYELVTACLG
jgi:hypothetical protein